MPLDFRSRQEAWRDRSDVKEIRGDRQVQCDVLVALAECRNHRKWFADFAKPYLGDHPIEIGSGLGDYAREWIPFVGGFTATDADEAMIIGLKREMAGRLLATGDRRAEQRENNKSKDASHHRLMNRLG